MRIVAVHKFNNKITEYKLDTGKIIDTAECIQLVKDGKIEGCNVGINRQGEEFVRSNRGSKNTEKEVAIEETPKPKIENTTQAVAETQTPKRRGRPKKVVAEQPIEENTQVESTTQTVADAQTPKRRGRPKKVVTEQPIEEKNQVLTDSITNLNDLPTF